MLDVHGIAVSGPTFPADIWHLFMEAADGSRADVPFPAPTTKPVWLPWRGSYEYGLSYGTPSATTTTTTTTAKPKPKTVATATTPTFTATPTTTVAPPDTTTAPPETTDTTQTTTP